MKKFDFKLEKILKVREFQQEQAELDLGKAIAKETSIQNKIETLAVQHQNVVHQIESSNDFTVISSAQQFFRMLDVQKEYLLNELTQAKLVTEEKRKILQDKMKKTMSLEKLREKELSKYQQESLIDEENLIDDIVTSRYGRH